MSGPRAQVVAEVTRAYGVEAGLLALVVAAVALVVAPEGRRP